MISLIRLCLILPFVCAFLNQNVRLALIIFIIASFSDGLDGWIARVFNCQSRLGLILDPLADKILIIVCFLLLGFQGYIYPWLVCLVLFRDFAILFGAFLALFVVKKTQPLVPTLISKCNTVFQMLLIVLCLFHAGFSHVNQQMIIVISGLVACTTSLSFLHYLYLWYIEISKT